MSATVIAFPIGPAIRQALSPFLRAVAAPLPEAEPDLSCAVVMQTHLRHVHDLIEHLGPADAVRICAAGLEVAQRRLEADGGSK